jgi:hypothetical protein
MAFTLSGRRRSPHSAALRITLFTVLVGVGLGACVIEATRYLETRVGACVIEATRYLETRVVLQV